jgi:hypothetical protein
MIRLADFEDETEGITWECTCGAYPTQYEGSIDGKPFYFRLRHGWWTMTIAHHDPVLPKRDDCLIHREGEYEPYPDCGYMEHGEVMARIVAAALAFRAGEPAFLGEPEGPREEPTDR